MMPLVWGALLGMGVFLLVSASWRSSDRAPEATRDAASRRAGTRDVVVGASAGVTTSVVVWMAFGVAGLALVSGSVAAGLPVILRRASVASADRRIMAAWPEVVDDMVATCRSGATIVDAIAQLTEFRDTRISRGAREFVLAVSATSDVGQSLSLLKHEWSHPFADRLVETLRMANDVGGSGVIRALTTLGRDIRREVRVAGEVRARQAWVRVAAVIGVAAPWVVAIFLALRPEGRQAYASGAGTALLIVGALVTCGAYLIMLRAARPRPTARPFA